MSKTVFCIATSEYQAESTLDELRVAGLRDDQISLLLADRTRAIVRGVTGTVTIDSAVGWLPKVESILISGVGAFVGNGVLAAALGEAASGSHKGAIARALTGLGLASEQAEVLDERLRNGQVLLAVHIDEDEMLPPVHGIFEHTGAEEIMVADERAPVEAAPRVREEKWEKW